MGNLHLDAPMTLGRVHARHRWLLPLAAAVFVALAFGAFHDSLPWDRPITDAVVDARTGWLDRVFRHVSSLGSTRIVLLVSAVAAALAWKRCPRLALAIIVIALARPLTEWALKELVSRDRPDGDRLVNGEGPSFPSGHPLATAASWGVLPLVVALYTRRRSVWWSVAIAVWLLAVGVAMSRVWLGVHWTSDALGGLLLAVLGLAFAERAIRSTHRRHSPCPQVVQDRDRQGLDEVSLSTSSRM